MKGKSWINVSVHCSALMKEEYRWEAGTWAIAPQSRPISRVPCGSAQEKRPLTAGWHTAGGSSCTLPSFQASSPSDTKADRWSRQSVYQFIPCWKDERCLLKCTSGSPSWKVYLSLFVLYTLIFYSYNGQWREDSPGSVPSNTSYK